MNKSFITHFTLISDKLNDHEKRSLDYSSNRNPSAQVVLRIGPKITFKFMFQSLAVGAYRCADVDGSVRRHERRQCMLLKCTYSSANIGTGTLGEDTHQTKRLHTPCKAIRFLKPPAARCSSQQLRRCCQCDVTPLQTPLRRHQLPR